MCGHRSQRLCLPKFPLSLAGVLEECDVDSDECLGPGANLQRMSEKGVIVCDSPLDRARLFGTICIREHGQMFPGRISSRAALMANSRAVHAVH